MLGIDIKRGVASTLERVFASSGNQFDKLEILWGGTTAGISFKREDGKLDAKVIFPNIDETKHVSHDVFNNLIGYALHELGHAWYTENAPWDRARRIYGDYIGKLINGLEDPRIEQCVINSGHAPNARVLFETLTASILERDGYVEADDKRNIPFLLAIEGRRLNGYDIPVSSVVDASPWAKHIRVALRKAHTACSTEQVAKIAIELYKKIREQEKNQPTEDEPPTGGGGDVPPTDEDGEPPTDEQPPDDRGDGDEQPPDDGGDEPPTDEPPTGGEPPTGEKEPSEEEGNAHDDSFDNARDPEPSKFIEDALSDVTALADKHLARPTYSKPKIAVFKWE
jgi:hypothetical protein